MKLFYTVLLALLFYGTSHATIWNVTVADFSFNPATVNAVVGDVIQFNWASGIHTTTCGSGLAGTSLPAGAAEWDSPVTSGNATFSYTVAVEGNYLYGCTPHFAFGMKGNIIVSSSLPVLFGSFSVISNNGNEALLQWKTFAEVNTDYFSIRKSTDAANFHEIGRLKASGNSNITQSYQFADKELGKSNKYLYYEIVTVDWDKKESFSAIRTLRNNNIIKDNLIVALGPNPITRSCRLQVKFNSDKAGEMNVSVYNSSGQHVLIVKMPAFYGFNVGHLHVCDLPKGTYHIMFSLFGKTEIKKVMVF